MIVLNLCASISSSAASPIQSFSPDQIAEIVISNAVDGREHSALSLFDLYFNDGQGLKDRVSIVRLLINDAGWKALSGKARLTILTTLLGKGPLTAPIERELLYFVAQLGTVDAIKYLRNYLQSESNVTFYDDDYFPSLIPLWRRWILTRRLDGQILQGQGVVRPEEVTLLVSLWASSVHECEVRLGRPSVR
jgi:hypothetical protein